MTSSIRSRFRHNDVIRKIKLSSSSSSSLSSSSCFYFFFFFHLWQLSTGYISKQLKIRNKKTQLRKYCNKDKRSTLKTTSSPCTCLFTGTFIIIFSSFSCFYFLKLSIYFFLRRQRILNRVYQKFKRFNTIGDACN